MLTEINVSEKEKYIRFCESTPSVPLFLQPWWMDAVCKKGDTWEVFLYEEDDTIRGVWVCYVVRRLGATMVLQPQLTQYNGAWLIYDADASPNQRIQWEKKVLAYLIGRLHTFGFDYCNVNFPLNFTNWLPFYWQGFSQTTRYTYQMDDISDPEQCLKTFGSDKRARINKARKHLHVTEMSGEAFYEHLTRYRRQKGEKVAFTKAFFVRLHDIAITRHCGKVIAVADNAGTIHAAVFLVWDKERCYNLMTTIHPLYNHFGGSALMIYEAIKFMSGKVPVFDFEGSMSFNIESSFVRFGTRQHPYFNLRKANTLKGKLIQKWLE